MPSISVVVPVYKVEPYLHRCIDSILAQTFSDFELILVDDGSPDNCGAICDEYAERDSRIHVIHQENGGLSAARNAGLDWVFANSESEWLAFIDSDDFVSRDYLEVLLTVAIENHADVSAVGYRNFKTELIDCSKDDLIEKHIYSGREVCELLYFDAKRHRDPVACSTSLVSSCMKLYRRILFDNIRFPLGKLHEDQGTTYKVLYKASIVVVISAMKYYYCDNPNSIMRRKFSVKRYDDLSLLQEAADYFDKLDDIYMRECVNERIDKLAYSYYFQAKKAGIDCDIPKRYHFGTYLQAVRKVEQRFGVGYACAIGKRSCPTYLKVYLLLKNTLRIFKEYGISGTLSRLHHILKQS